MKADLREWLRSLRATLKPEERSAAEADVALHLDALLQHARTVGVYARHGSELDLTPWIQRWLRRGKSVAWPRVSIDGLVFAVCRPDELVKGYRGLREPPPDAHLVSAAYLDAILVPASGFDLAGHRLGQGGGFYDRLLASLRRVTPAPLAVGVGFDLQIVEALPVDAWDQPVDALVSERGPVLLRAAP